MWHLLSIESTQIQKFVDANPRNKHKNLDDLTDFDESDKHL